MTSSEIPHQAKGNSSLPAGQPTSLAPDRSLLDAVLCTDQLQQRPTRPADHAAENRALIALAQALADAPSAILQSLTDISLDLFQAGSAGISLLDEDETSFFWPAVSGLWKPCIGGSVPSYASPCGETLVRNEPQLFRRLDRCFDFPADLARPEEALLHPFHIAGKPVGTLWIVTHEQDRQFDLEDLRQLESLSRFASAAYQAAQAAQAVQIKSQMTTLLLDKAVESSRSMRQLNAQFIETEERYRSVFEAMDDSFCILEQIDLPPGEPSDFRYVDANPAFAALSGAASVADLLGRSIRQQCPGLHDGWCSSYDSVLANGESVRIEHESMTGTRWLELQVFRTQGHKGPRLAAIFKDITARRRAQDAMRKSEVFARSIVTSSPDCIKVLDLEGNLLSMESGQSLLGIDDIGPFLNKSWLDFWSDADRPGAQAAVACGASGGTSSFIGFYRTAKGEDKWWDVTISPIPPTGSEPACLLAVSRDVTQKKRADDQLNYRTAQLERLVTMAPLGIYMIDADFRLLHVNPAAQPAFGKIEPLIDEDFEQIMLSMWGPERSAVIVDRFRHTLASGVPYIVPELIAERYDRRGTESYEWQIHRITLPDGRYGVVCYFRDISEQLKTLQAVRDSEERYRRLLASINEGYCVVDVIFDAHDKPVDYRILEINGVFENLTGIQDAVGQCIRDLVPDLEQYWFDTYGRVALTGEPARIVSEVKALDRWFDVYSYRVGGSDSRKVAIVFNNITEQKKTEKALRESEALYRSLFNAMDEGFFVMDVIFDANGLAQDYRFLEMNPVFEKQSGLTHAVGKRVREIMPAHEESWFELYGKVAFTGEPVRAQLEAPVLKRWFDIQAFRIGSPGSFKVAVIFNNITERMNAQQTLKQQAQVLTDLGRRKDEFLAMLSHELRNPLAAISNATHLLRLQHHEDPVIKKSRGIIERQVGQLNHLVNDLLEISRITTGRIQLRLEQVSIQNVIERALETTHPLMVQRRHALTLTLPKEPVWVRADAARLEQVVVNLVNNAAKYTEEGGKITVSLTRQEGQAVMRVLDNGLGITPELLPRVFDLFTQAERSLDRSQGGLGIGLCLVQRLVHLHEGQVEAHSTVGRGSEFVVRLPMLAVASLSTPAPAVAKTAPERSPLRVLVVDDNVDAATSLGDILSLVGHDVRMAHDGLDALQSALDWCPDVVLLDIGLPRMNGLEIARRLRVQPGFEAMVLIALTGYGQDADHMLSMEAGFDYHLVKPANFAEVDEILQAVLQRPTASLA